MKIKHLLPLQRIIAKVDNDFNIDQSDWIPRVAAWTIDAMSILKCTPYVKKRFKCCVNNRIACCVPSLVDTKNVKVYDNNGCQIDNLNHQSVAFTPFNTSNEFERVKTCCEEFGINDKVWNSDEADIYKDRPEVMKRLLSGNSCITHTRNFVVIDSDKIELNYDTDWIVVEAMTVATYYDEYFNEEVPFVYDNGLLLDAISWYIMMKILQRGYKHQVFSLSGAEPVNPYIQWNKLKDNAAASVKKDIKDNTKNDGWNNFFYNLTFLPRR